MTHTRKNFRGSQGLSTPLGLIVGETIDASVNPDAAQLEDSQPVGADGQIDTGTTEIAGGFEVGYEPSEEEVRAQEAINSFLEEHTFDELIERLTLEDATVVVIEDQPVDETWDADAQPAEPVAHDVEGTVDVTPGSDAEPAYPEGTPDSYWNLTQIAAWAADQEPEVELGDGTKAVKLDRITLELARREKAQGE